MLLSFSYDFFLYDFSDVVEKQAGIIPEFSFCGSLIPGSIWLKWGNTQTTTITPTGRKFPSYQGFQGPYVLELWENTRTPVGDPCRHQENM